MLGSLTVTNILVVLVCLIISLTIHEFMHGYVGYLLGDTTAQDHGRLTLNPLKHIDPVMTILLPLITLIVFRVPFLAAKPVPFNPDRVRFDEYGAALLAAAGPFSNLVLAIIGAIIVRYVDLGVFLDQAFVIFVSLNVIIFIFNLIPIPPLDGSRVLYAFSPEVIQDFMRKIEPFGFVIIVGLVLIGGFGGIINTLYNYIITALGHI